MVRHLWWVLGLVLVGGGVLLALFTQPGPDDVGWFAYTPLSDDSDWRMTWDSRRDGSILLVSRWQLAGCAVAAIGLMLVAAGVGFHLGRRRTDLAEPN